MKIPQPDNTIYTEVARDGVFVNCSSLLYRTKLNLENLEAVGLISSSIKNDTIVHITHRNTQEPEYWESLSSWLYEALN